MPPLTVALATYSLGILRTLAYLVVPRTPNLAIHLFIEWFLVPV